jgi:hypothetical protein
MSINRTYKGGRGDDLPPYAGPTSGLEFLRILPSRLFALRRVLRSNLLGVVLFVILLTSYWMLPGMSGAHDATDGSSQDTGSLELVSKVSTNVHLHMGRSSDQEKDLLVKKFVEVIVNSPFAKPPKNYLSMCAIFRNEEASFAGSGL